MKPLPQTTEAVRELIAHGEASMGEELARIGRQISQLIPSCVGVSLTLLTDRWTLTLVAEDDLARRIDLAQYLEDGPCIAVVEGRANVIALTTSGLMDEGRWQLFARAMAVEGVQSSLSLPILRDDMVIAGINLYASTPDGFDGHHDAIAQICRSTTASIVSNADLTFRTRLEAVTTPTRMYDHNDIELAVTMLASTMGTEPAASRRHLESSAAKAGISTAAAARLLIRLRAQ